MKGSRLFSLCWLASVVAPAACESLLQVLQTFPDLSTFNGYVANSSSNNTAFLNNANNFTFLAPSNNAIKSFIASGGVITNDLIEATIQYSLLNGGYPGLAFTNESQFVESNLINITASNVTGGQRVELVLSPNGVPQVVTGNKSISTSTTPDLICTGGFVHVMDEFLEVPVPVILEITDANLQFFSDILNVGGYLNASNAGYVNGITEQTDVTYFIPNSQEALTNAMTVIKSNGSAAELQALFEYHIVPGLVAYSPDLKNGSVFKTVQGDNVTITLQGEDIFVNSAKVTSSDWIVANGVIHVLDSLLDRFNQSGPPAPAATNSASSSSTPTPTPTPSPSPSAVGSPLTSTSIPATSSSGSSGLSTGAKVGIGIGVPVFALGAIAVLGILFLRFKTRRQDAQRWDAAVAGNRSFGSRETDKYYVNRGTLQRQNETGLGSGVQNTPEMSTMAAQEDQISGGGGNGGNGGYQHHMDIGGSSSAGGYEENQIGTTTTAIAGGPNVPQKSPSRTLKGGYF